MLLGVAPLGTLPLATAPIIAVGTAIFMDGALPLAWLGAIRGDGMLPIETGATDRYDGGMPLEWSGASALLLDGLAPLEWGGTVQLSGSLPAETLGSLLRDCPVAVELNASLHTDGSIVLAWSAAAFIDAGAPLEFGGAAIFAGRVFLLNEAMYQAAPVNESMTAATVASESQIVPIVASEQLQ